MKHLLLATIAALVLVGCGVSISIHDAAKSGDIEAVKQYLANGTAVNEGIDGFTPLAFAVDKGHKEIAEILISKGEDVNAKLSNDEGIVSCTPLFFAARSGHTEVAELLIANGADVNAKDENVLTPLDYATLEKQSETANFLRKHGGKRGVEIEAAGK